MAQDKHPTTNGVLHTECTIYQCLSVSRQVNADGRSDYSGIDQINREQMNRHRHPYSTHSSLDIYEGGILNKTKRAYMHAYIDT